MILFNYAIIEDKIFPINLTILISQRQEVNTDYAGAYIYMLNYSKS